MSPPSKDGWATAYATLAHNLIAHPIAGLLWALGMGSVGDRVHRWWAPAAPPKAGEP